MKKGKTNLSKELEKIKIYEDHGDIFYHLQDALERGLDDKELAYKYNLSITDLEKFKIDL
ncbi:hypothetical protein [Anaerobranca gottschalkii]|uniref:Uncharacterized protein n=1 Tax=Anaerobranca gottschalkii DSM 13577 TaxID=1120990 RepID=A0A1I0ARX6_9FIRM|nr:hypothetical protein [Anaerobranca gottschalkii]SES97143.1 hypothetical protein SAMN03080614_10267 [Anaerobranca gottschalkii DSM 13577]